MWMNLNDESQNESQF